MEPQLFAAIGAAVAVGIMGGKIVEHIWPNSKGTNGWRSKIEILVEQQLKCMDKQLNDSAEQTRLLGLMEHRMNEHEKRESRAWHDMFELVRDLKGGS